MLCSRKFLRRFGVLANAAAGYRFHGMNRIYSGRTDLSWLIFSLQNFMGPCAFVNLWPLNTALFAFVFLVWIRKKKQLPCSYAAVGVVAWNRPYFFHDSRDTPRTRKIRSQLMNFEKKKCFFKSRYIPDLVCMTHQVYTVVHAAAWELFDNLHDLRTRYIFFLGWGCTASTQILYTKYIVTGG